uniref:Receptor kinase-like protein Xa21 n=1 Tax=Oryza barthii TaxID=65489 RepID=A0A0D3HIS3_9ORYZ
MKAPHRVISLNLGDQGLVGTVSPSLGNLTFLRYLFLQENLLAGQIPLSLGHLHHLKYLYLSNNTLQGEIPDFANCSNLKMLGLGGNHLVGQVPTDANLPPSLYGLDISNNNLTGTIPSSLFNITTLAELFIQHNQINGEIPREIGKSRFLQEFSASGNKLSGRFQQTILNISSLAIIDLGTNYLHGELPSNLGVVPSSIGKLKELSWVNLEINQLQGLEFMNNLKNGTNLQKLSVASNQLEGEIPNSFGNFSVKLQVLYLGSNRLSGRFPPGIANLHYLSGLALESNCFTGPIPDWLGNLKTLQSQISLLEEALLDSNHFYAHIPRGLESLKVLQVLNISNNNLHGNIPREIFSIPTTRVVELSSNRLDGPLPIEMGNAKQLQSLHKKLGSAQLSHNLLSGSIPKSIGGLQDLQQLDLSFNNLEGEVPEIGIFSNITAVRIAGNTGLCGGAAMLQLPPCSSRRPSSTKHMVSVVLKVVIPFACIVSLAMGISALLFWRKRNERKSMSLTSFGRKFSKVSFNDLASATDGFSTYNLIGRGRYSSVYKGRLLQYGNVVAVKVFSLQTRGSQKSFITECHALRNVRHRNLVPILTACSSIDSKGDVFKALVYEFMSQGDLHMILYSTQNDENNSALIQIALAQRLSIVVDVAAALEYLHHNNQGTIVHCDLKPGNILLDDNMIAHVGDFGLARFKVDCTVSSSGDSTISSAINGTIGYVAPEYAAGGEVSTYGDVYSCGIVLFEIFLRKRPTDDMFKDGLNIATFVEMNFPDRISQVVDPELLENQNGISHETLVDMKEKDLECLHSVLNIGLCCTKPSPYERMDMREVAARLRKIKAAHLSSN